MNKPINRRTFFHNSAWAGASVVAGAGLISATDGDKSLPVNTPDFSTSEWDPKLPSTYALDLEPARWIWYPSQRTLANTFVLFRRELTLSGTLKSAKGWILGDSRYLLMINGKRVQWGPAPSDPRYSEADPIELTQYLQTGKNVIGVTVLYFGLGDGTWPVGKPGFIFYLDIEFTDGSKQQILSDESWKVKLARSWKPGQYKRWYLRALQEEFDARLYPDGWTSSDYIPDDDWIQPEILKGSASEPALNTNSADYLNNSSGAGGSTELRKRSVPLLIEENLAVDEMVESFQVNWKRPVEEYFEMIPPSAYTVDQGEVAKTVGPNQWEVELSSWKETGAVLLFSFEEQIVGWPYFSVEAPEGTIIELLVQEGHTPLKEGGVAIMNNHFNSWTRFICKSGINRFITFDFESVKWLQLHIHNASEKVTIKDVGIRRRYYSWPYHPSFKCSDAGLQRLIEASINTVYNNAHETIADGMGRERQQYSGDIGHELHTLYSAFGEHQLPARYLNTYSQGLTKEGYFLDTWPAYDRLNRIAQRQLNLTPWGPLLDHGIQFNLDCYHHYLYTGRLQDLEEVFPRLLRFADYLQKTVGKDGLLPVKNLGIPTVWMDTDAYQKQRHKKCAFNLYAAAMLIHAFPELCNAFDHLEAAKRAKSLGQSILKQTIDQFWDAQSQVFICNLPWAQQEGGARMCERSLSLAVLYDLCPQNNSVSCVDALTSLPSNLGRLYPANGIWTLWALAKAERIDAIFKDFEDRWLKMDSVHQNNTMQEAWLAKPDSNSQWSHASIGPLISAYMDIAGIRPTKPGFTECTVKPLLGPLESLELQNHTPQGPIQFKAVGPTGNRRIELSLPPGVEGQLIVNAKEKLKLTGINNPHYPQHGCYRLLGGQTYKIRLKYT